MAWIKRNLFFFVGGLVALGLLGAAGFCNYTSWSRNSEKFDKLNEIYSTLKGLNTQDASPGNDKVNKTEQAKDQENQLKGLLEQTRGYFQPIAAIPPSTPSDPVTSRTFASALSHTIDALQHEATNANVGLPPAPAEAAAGYAFSFEAEDSLVQFSPGSLDALAVQLGEVKTIAEILYAAGVNNLDGIQRVRVSDDDSKGSGADFTISQPVTNTLAIITPYVVNYRCFSPEIAQVFAGFAGSSHGFVIKTINVLPAGESAMAQYQPPRRYNQYNPPNMQPVPNQAPGRGGMTTILQEQLLRVTMEIDIIKLRPQN